jgi:hypothetical protein
VLSKFGGRATFTCRWGWDGVSTFPDCDGPILDVTLTNSSPHAWQIQLPVGRAAKTRTLAAGASRTWTSTQVASIGLVNASDFWGFRMVDLTAPS